MQARDESVPRRTYITRALLDKYGVTDSCLGCTSAILGGTGVPHSEECRRRIQRLMREDPEDQGKVREAERKRKAFVDKHLRGEAKNSSMKDEHCTGSSPTMTPDTSNASHQGGSSSSSSGQKRGLENPEPVELNPERIKTGDVGAPPQLQNGLKRTREVGDEGDQDDRFSERVIMEVACEETELYDITDDEMPKLIANSEDDIDDSNERKRMLWADINDDDTDDDAYGETIYDDLTGQVLDPKLVAEARSNEVKALIEMGVWEAVPEAQCLERTGRKPISARWVDINKGDDRSPNYRSRYVAREIRQQHGGALRDGLFAAMPPLEALKVLISRTVSNKRTFAKPHKILFIDISKAYLHADVEDPDVYVDSPKEVEQLDGSPKMCGRLLKALYGTRLAARCWEKEYTKTFEAMGFVRGKTSPCLFKHEIKGMSAFVHGDDFVISGLEKDLNEVKRFISDRYITKARGLLGPEANDDKAIVILNRILEWREDGIAMEADTQGDGLGKLQG